jgi:TrmH family RNA methyltransferase
VPSTLSPQNPRLARARELLDARGRREQGALLIEGPTLVAEAQAAGLAFTAVYVAETAAERFASAVAGLEALGVPAFVLPERALARLSDLSTPPGLIGVVALPAHTAADVLARSGPVLLLAGVNDPGNAGTLVRSAEAFGAAGVLAGAGGADPYAPKVVRAAMGSLFRLPVAVVSADEVLDGARLAGRPIVAADLSGTPLGGAEVPANAVIAVGNERHGVREFLPRWDRAVRIEQSGAAESLNAAVAGSVILYVVSRRT